MLFLLNFIINMNNFKKIVEYLKTNDKCRKITFITSAQWTHEFFTGETFKGQKTQKSLVTHLVNEMTKKFFKKFLKPQHG